MIALQSFFLVAVTEMGDKTQLLAFVLATRFKSTFAILAGIFVATIANHSLAALVGQWVASSMPANFLKWILGALFIGFGAWVLIPDSETSSDKPPRFGAFLTTAVTFFIAEMGDKTQLSTVALAARFNDVGLVTLGTTAGMMLSDGLAVFMGRRLTDKIPLKAVRIFAALVFFAFGITIWTSTSDLVRIQ